MEVYLKSKTTIKGNRHFCEWDAETFDRHMDWVGSTMNSELKPAKRFLGNSVNQQLIHVESELKEVVDAIYNRNDSNRSVAEILDELNDLQISAETLKAIIEPDEDKRIGSMSKTIEKNRARGYYEVDK